MPRRSRHQSGLQDMKTIGNGTLRLPAFPTNLPPLDGRGVSILFRPTRGEGQMGFGSEADGEADLRVEIVTGMVGALVAVQVLLVDPPQAEVGVASDRQVCPRAHHRIEVGKVVDEHAPVEHPHVTAAPRNQGENVLNVRRELVNPGVLPSQDSKFKPRPGPG